MRNINSYAVIWILASMLMYGCSGDKSKTADESKKKADQLDAIVLVGDDSLGEKEVMAYVRSRSHRGTASQILDRALDELVVAELLYQEAILQKIDQQPEVRQAMRQLLGQKLLEEQVNRPVLTRRIEEEELRQYYDQHRELYARPEQIRLADIFLAVPEDSDEAILNQQKKKAEDLLMQARSTNNERFGFSRLIRDYSDKNPRYKLGDTGFFDRSGLPAGLSEELAAAGFSLSGNGKIADRVVQTADGFHIIKLVARRQPFSRDFKSAAQEIEQKIRKEELAAKRTAYIASLRKKSRVEIQQDILEKTRQELKDSREQAGGADSSGNKEKPVLPGQ